MPEPINPPGVPIALDFELKYDPRGGILTQEIDKKISLSLDSAYRFGNELGNALSETDLALPYANDFLLVIKEKFQKISSGMRALEIGAGTGYLTSRLARLGFNAVGIEPGAGFTEDWESTKATMVNDFFPSSEVKGKFDLICAYMVLEHIPDPLQFLRDVALQLDASGFAILAVPDCTEELIDGDPSILIHEHISYFDADSLKTLAESAGFAVTVQKSSYGRCLYGILSLGSDRKLNHNFNGDNYLRTYPLRAMANIEMLTQKFQEFTNEGSLGIFCPARALYLLNLDIEVRFFEDDLRQIGKYLPPLTQPIEGRKELLENPVDNLIIMSRTFGSRIFESLRNDGYDGKIHLIQDLYE
jgi:SAM-dependent methyltransferase